MIYFMSDRHFYACNIASGLSLLLNCPVNLCSYDAAQSLKKEDIVILDSPQSSKHKIGIIPCLHLIIISDKRHRFSGKNIVFVPPFSGISEIAFFCKQMLLGMERHSFISSPALSEIEESIIHYMSLGKSDKEIAMVINQSVSFIKYHLRKIYKKLGVKNRTQAALKLLQNSV